MTALTLVLAAMPLYIIGNGFIRRMPQYDWQTTKTDVALGFAGLACEVVAMGMWLAGVLQAVTA